MCRMLLQLVRVMIAYASRAEEWQAAVTRAATGKGMPAQSSQ